MRKAFIINDNVTIEENKNRFGVLLRVAGSVVELTRKEWEELCELRYRLDLISKPTIEEEENQND